MLMAKKSLYVSLELGWLFLVENIVSADALQEDHAWTGDSLSLW